MKKILLAIVFAYCTLAAQDSIRVNFKGASPSINDFAWALLSSTNNEEDCTDEAMNALKQAWIQHRKGKALSNGGDSFHRLQERFRYLRKHAGQPSAANRNVLLERDRQKAQVVRI